MEKEILLIKVDFILIAQHEKLLAKHLGKNLLILFLYYLKKIQNHLNFS